MRRIVHTGVAIGLAVGLTGCAANNPEGNSSRTDSTPTSAEQFDNPPLPADFSFPGRVTLTEASCEAWGPTSSTVRQEGRLVNGKLFAIIDARNSWPPNCDPETDSGAGLYTDASYASPAVALNGDTHLKDGTIVQVIESREGQEACNPNGNSTRWLGVLATPAGPEVFVPEVNTGFGPLSEQLAEANIPSSHMNPAYKNAPAVC